MFKYMDSKSSLIDTLSDHDYIHTSWELSNGKIISYENIWANYPRSSIIIHDSIDEYIDCININWMIKGIRNCQLLSKLIMNEKIKNIKEIIYLVEDVQILNEALEIVYKKRPNLKKQLKKELPNSL